MPKDHTTYRVLLSIAALIIIIAGMKAAESLLVPFFLSVFIAIISAPAVFWMKNRHVPTVLAILIVLLIIVSLMAGMATLLGTSINDFTNNMPKYSARFSEELSHLQIWAAKFGIEINTTQLISYVDPGKAMQLVSKTLSGFSGALSQSFLIMLTTIFIIVEASSFPVKLRQIFGNNASLHNFDAFTNTIKDYMVIKSMTSFITGAIITVALIIIGIDYPLLWGLLAFLLNFVPTIGSIIAAIPAVILAIVQLQLPHVTATILTYITVNTIIGNIIEPRFMGKELGLSTLVVFLSLVFWGWILGPVGMLLSVPLTMTMKIALDSNAETRWLAIILGPEQLPEKTNAS